MSNPFSPSRLDPALQSILNDDPVQLPSEDPQFTVEPPTPTRMLLEHLNNASQPHEGFLQDFWETDDPSRSTSAGALGSEGNQSSNSSLNNALRRHSVGSSGSFDESVPPLPADQEGQGQQEEQFVVPMAPPSFVVGPGPRLTSTGKVSHARKVPAFHIKRPRNAFILFRSHACSNNLVPTQLGITDHRHISRIVGNLWKSLPAEEKKIWEDLAEKEKEEHKLQNPNYKYRPVYRREGAVRRRRKKPSDDAEVEDEERKAEVVARVLLEGGDVQQGNLERELELQREKDIRENRKRGLKSRSLARRQRSRSRQEEEEDLDNRYPAGARRNPARKNRDKVYDLEQEFYLPQETGMYFGDNGQTFQPQPDPQFYPNYYYGQETSIPIDYDVQTQSNPFAENNHVSFDFLPATPRTFAMQQHQQNIASRMRFEPGTPFSPTFNALDLSNNQLPLQYGQEQAQAAFVPFTGRAASLDTAGNIQLRSPRAFSADPWQQPQGSNHFFEQAHQQQPSPHFPSDLNRLMNEPIEGHLPFSAMGEMANPFSTLQQGDIALQPQDEVQYVFLSREQARNTQLVQEIRERGFGITYDADPAELTGMLQMTS